MTLQEWMSREGLNDAALASRTGKISRSQISRIRRGISRPEPATARELERLTGIPAATFVMGEAAASARLPSNRPEVAAP